MKRIPFHTILKEGRPLLIDGAMGTELYNRGIFINRCFEDANLTSPHLVKNLHQEYLDAGAKILTTNSWGANFCKLKEYNLHDKLVDINRAAAALAREVAQEEAYVAGSVGPLGIRIEPFGPTSLEEAKQYFKDQISALAKGDIDLISLETFSDLTELQQAILAAREVAPHLPIIAYTTMTPDGLSLLGTPIDWSLKKIAEWNVDALGLNCSTGPQPMLTCIEKVKDHIKKPLSVCPNAGLPRVVDGRHIYMSSPEYMAEFAKNFLQTGVQFIGGCCGTSPAHTKAMSNTIRHALAMEYHSTSQIKSSQRSEEKLETKHKHTHETTQERVPLANKSLWSKKLSEGKKVFSVELLPPAGIDPTQILELSRKIHLFGIDAINIPDGPRASARMSAIMTAIMIEQQVGIETVLHYTCRDRNLLGMQSDMLGANAIGLRNMLLVTGDPPKLGSYPDATGVFDVDAIGLTNMVYKLNGGTDLGGRSIGLPPRLSIGVGVNPVHRDFDYEMKRFAWKVEAGAEWAITQPVFDVQALFKFLEYLDTHNIKIPIIAGVWPLQSYRNAVFMNNEVPGVVIPEAIMKKMAKPQNAEEAKKLGVELAIEMIHEIYPHVSGFQLSAPFGRVDLVLDIAKSTPDFQ